MDDKIVQVTPYRLGPTQSINLGQWFFHFSRGLGYVIKHIELDAWEGSTTL